MPPKIYHLHVKGQLGDDWSDWFDGMTIASDENGDAIISGLVLDQSALHALLVKIRDLGLTLVSLDCVDPGYKPMK